jgi:hypothetical protein
MLRSIHLTLICVAAFALAACGGSGVSRNNVTTGGNTPATPAGLDGAAAPHAQSAGGLSLAFRAVPEGSDWRVTLAAPSARDLYQIAGSVEFDASQFEIVSPEAGGGLGGPGDAFFTAKESTPGKLDFAYTIRRYGPGRDGAVDLLSLLVRQKNPASGLSDTALARAFRLQTADGATLARSSSKQRFELNLQEVR